MPSLPGHAADNHLTWKAYTGSSGYPVEFYTQLKGSSNIVRSAAPSAQFLADAATGSLPALSMVWHDSPYDEHPPAYVTRGHDAIWQAVDAVATAGWWNSTVFLLTWDDWGGYDDHVATPNVETDLGGIQLAYGPRLPLLKFGGRVRPGIDHRWCSHGSIPKTALQLFGLPASACPAWTTIPGSPTSPTSARSRRCSHRPRRATAPPSPSHHRRSPLPPPARRRPRQHLPPQQSDPYCSATAPPCPHPTTSRSTRAQATEPEARIPT